MLHVWNLYLQSLNTPDLNSIIATKISPYNSVSCTVYSDYRRDLCAPPFFIDRFQTNKNFQQGWSYRLRVHKHAHVCVCVCVCEREREREREREYYYDRALSDEDAGHD